MVVLLLGLFANAHAVPPVLNYAGQVAVNGEAFDGAGLFKFALVNTDGTTTYWSNDGTSVDGSEPQASVSLAVSGGLYAILLGNTAQQGMGAIDPALFAQHTDAKLRVWFSDGVNGFQQLTPDRPFASVPYAFSAGTAQTALSATIAPGSIDRSMLSGDIRSDLNRTISHNDLSPQIKADINATIGLDRLSSAVISKLEQNATITYGSVTGSKMAGGAVTASKIADGAITTDKLNEQILKYLKPEITSQPQAQTVYEDTNVSYSISTEGKYLTYQWKKDGSNLTNETNSTLTIIDANATLHDGNYSVVVSNDFGSVESDLTEVLVKDEILNGLVGWWKFDEGSGTVAYDSSGNGNNGNLTNGPTWTTGKIGGALSFDGVNDYLNLSNYSLHTNFSFSFWANPTSNSSTFSESINANISTSGNNRIILHGSRPQGFPPSSNAGFGISIGKNCIYAIAHSSGLYTPMLVRQASFSDWSSFTFIVNNNTPTLFVDGEFIKNGLNPNKTLHFISNSGVAIGKGAYGSYQGLIDDVRIYDRALSAEELQALYNMGQ